MTSPALRPFKIYEPFEAPKGEFGPKRAAPGAETAAYPDLIHAREVYVVPGSAHAYLHKIEEPIMSAPLAKRAEPSEPPSGRPRKRPANQPQGGPELWARIDALRGGGLMDYPPQPVHKEFDYGW